MRASVGWVGLHGRRVNVLVNLWPFWLKVCWQHSPPFAFCSVDGQGKKNFLIGVSKTHQHDIEEHLQELTNRKDISRIFITLGCAEMIRVSVDAHNHSGQLVPVI